ncbi:MAG TPA: alpha-L-arabinofuranosidase C-terminal domain-containing protein [Candidatus Acidoferrales bacterium]|nr:alpha-L-arabinofuranosidase C-terminal domain-containing protein [Candidatus Acidoferrales bacterium]
MKRPEMFLSLLLSVVLPVHAQVKESTAALDASNIRYKINKNIYGQFSEHLGHCIYGGIWVGENSSIPNIDGMRKDVIDALREIHVPVLRWPGGCFADEYHWMNGVGPRDLRPKMINTNWGDVTEDNSFGTHEYLEFCKLIGCDPYITGNVGSGTVQEFSQWVEYVNSDNVSPMTDLRKKNGRENSWGVKYWGLGNESWGCGGTMTPEYYADQVRRYGTFLKNYGKNKIFKIACGPGGSDYNWTEVLMKKAKNGFDGLSLHYYTFENRKPAADFDESGWFNTIKGTLKMDELIDRNCAIMDKYDPGKRVALVVDEYGTWYAVEPGTNPAFLYQQNTMRDAIAAACNLNIFNNHCDRVRMANIAQMVNVLQAMILTDSSKMVLTPTYYVFDLFKVHQDAEMIPIKLNSAKYIFKGDTLPAVNASASLDNDGRVHISLCNVDPDASEKISIRFLKFDGDKISGKILTAARMNAENTFENPDQIMPKTFSDFTFEGNDLVVDMPPMSVVVLEATGTIEMPPAIEIKNPIMGINYSYYEGRWEDLPNFNTMAPVRKGSMANFAIPNENSGENFAVEYDGYIKIPKDGSYAFYLNSDDGSSLYIDDNLVVSNDGLHAPEEQSGNVFLKAGYHNIKVGFFQAGGGMTLEVSIEGPGLAKEVIPAGMLFEEGK